MVSTIKIFEIKLNILNRDLHKFILTLKLSDIILLDRSHNFLTTSTTAVFSMLMEMSSIERQDSKNDKEEGKIEELLKRHINSTILRQCPTTISITN